MEYKWCKGQRSKGCNIIKCIIKIIKTLHSGRAKLECRIYHITHSIKAVGENKNKEETVSIERNAQMLCLIANNNK